MTTPMKFTKWIPLVALIATGCSISHGNIAGAKFTNFRGIWETRGFVAEIPTTNGMMRIEIASSRTDKETAKVIAQEVLEGLKAYFGGGFSVVPPASKGLQQ